MATTGDHIEGFVPSGGPILATEIPAECAAGGCGWPTCDRHKKVDICECERDYRCWVHSLRESLKAVYPRRVESV